MFVSFAENSSYASNYRSEIVGAIAEQLILRATIHNAPAQYQEIPTYYDNQEVLNHGSKAERGSKEKQAQCNVCCTMKECVPDNPVKTIFT